MSTFWQKVILTPEWVWIVACTVGLAFLVMAVASWRREAFGYLRQARKDLASVAKLGPLCLKGAGCLWRFGREKAIQRWPACGRSSGWYIYVVGAAAGLLVSLTAWNATQLLKPPVQPVSLRANSWTTSADWRAWDCQGLEVGDDGTIRLLNTGGRGAWVKVPDRAPLPVGWHNIAATQTDVWLDGGVSVIQIDLENPGQSWTEHQQLGAGGNQIGAIWANGREAVVLSTYGAAVHWNGSRWEELEKISKEDGSWLEAHCAHGRSWNDLWVGAKGAIFHRLNGTWTMDVTPSSNIGIFSGITADSNGLIWACNEEGSIWRRKSNGDWGTVANAPIKWAGIQNVNGQLMATDEIGCLYLVSANGQIQPKSLPLKVRSISRNIGVGSLQNGHTSLNLQTGQMIEGPTDDDLIKVVAPSATRAWAISSSAVYRYDSVPEFNSSGSATIALPRTMDLEQAPNLLADVPPGTQAEVLYSIDGITWQEKARDLEPGVVVFIRLNLRSRSDRTTPVVRALTLP
jgi:hypothetical protein